MSNLQAVTMQELELESAELLPSRETLNCWKTHPSGSVTQINNGNAIGTQVGLVNVNVAALNGNVLGGFL
jgi:hypothetical protein